jgi:hypothetical protein
MTRWTVMVSKETDIALRSFLAQRGLKRGKFSDLASEDLQTLIDEATTNVATFLHLKSTKAL